MSIDKGVYTVTASNRHGEVSSSCNISYSAFDPDVRSASRQSSKTSRWVTLFPAYLLSIYTNYSNWWWQQYITKNNKESSNKREINNNNRGGNGYRIHEGPGLAFLLIPTPHSKHTPTSHTQNSISWLTLNKCAIHVALFVQHVFFLYDHMYSKYSHLI